MTRARDALATYADAADLIQIGAYVSGSDARVDASRVVVPRIEAMMRQRLDDVVSRDAALAALGAAVGGAS